MEELECIDQEEILKHPSMYPLIHLGSSNVSWLKSNLSAISATKNFLSRNWLTKSGESTPNT